MKKVLIYFFTVLTGVIFYSCREEVVNPNTPGVTSVGAYVLSEGGFSSGSSKLSFYNLLSNTFTENIFNPTNIGLFPDGLILSSNQLYLTEQGNFNAEGKIHNLDTSGTVIQSHAAGINPYSVAAVNEKIYITNGPTNSVTVLNRSDLSPVTTITVGLYPQEILALGTKVFVCNTSVFGGGTDSTVSVIDAATDQVVATIFVRKKPSSLAISRDGQLLVGCPGDASTGIIYKINPLSYVKVDSFFISNGFALGFDKDIAVNTDNDDVYFISYLNNIVKLNLSTKLHSVFIPNSNTAVDFFYGYNYDPRNQKHYIANAKDFVSNGSVLLYDGNGNNLNTFATGIIPRRIVVKF
ncbi:MAG: YncE family protein [Ignavibacteria bacterium]